MTSPAPFLGREIGIAVGIAVLAQLSFIGLFLLPPPEAVEADVSDDRAKPIAISITPVPLLKLGSPHPSKLPGSWERTPAAAKAAKAAPPDPRTTAQPSTKADPETPSVKERDASVAAMTSSSAAPADSATPTGTSSAEAQAPSDGGAPGPASSQLGAANGSADGTETDPLKARAADMYRAQLASWFAGRFAIRGKVPFDDLKVLSATAVVSISPERRVTGFSIGRPSGNPSFDDEVRATLTRIQSSGAELPAPPPAYPEMLARSVPVSFRCTKRSQCE